MTARSAHERTLAVIGDFYDAALDESLWPAALKNLADLTASQAASFWVLDGSGHPQLPTFISINFDEKSIQEYLNGMAPLDPTVRYLVGHPQQSIVHDGLLTNDRDEDSRAYYDWHERSVETRFRMVGQARVASGVQAGVALHRTRKAGSYEPRDIQRFTALHRHLQRALAIGFQLGSLRAMQQFSTDWLDRGNSAVVLLDERQGVIFANRAAEVLQTNADGIRLSAEGIRLARQQDNHKLQSLIAQALSPIASPDLSAGGAMRASRPSGKPPYGIFVGPVSKQSIALTLFRPAVCVVITDPDRGLSSPAERLQVLFGFTEAEARLAALLAAGEELRRAAEQLEITYGTARTRLAQIFQKTDTRRQGQLIRLLLATLGTD
jgi:DNA-binding CsgD family transcriptional regulator